MSETFNFEKQSIVVFYDQEGKPGKEAYPVKTVYEFDDKGNVEKNLSYGVKNDQGEIEYFPYLTFFSDVPLSSFNKDDVKAVDQGKKTAADIFGSVFEETDHIQGVVYSNPETGDSMALTVDKKSQWKDHLANFFRKTGLTAQTPPASKTPRPTETPAPRLNVPPEVKAVLDAQKAVYKVEASGKAIITVEGKEVVLESLVDTKTDFGLAEDIINGRDKEGTRYIFTEKGWIKDIDLSATTPESRIMVPFEL